MWAQSATRAAGSHNDQCHATRRCRNISPPGHRPSRQSLQQLGLGTENERGLIFRVWYADDLGQSAYVFIQKLLLSGAMKSYTLLLVASSGHISQQMLVRCKMDYQMSSQFYVPMESSAAAFFTVLTDGCSTRSAGVAGAIQTTQSSRSSLSNLQLQYRGKKSCCVSMC